MYVTGMNNIRDVIPFPRTPLSARVLTLKMLKQSLQQKQLQRLSPQQIQLMKLLQVPTVELEARIKEELEANPALEEGLEQENKNDLAEQEVDRDESLEEFNFDEYLDDDTPDFKISIRNHGSDVEEKDIPLGAGATFREQLISQLGLQIWRTTTECLVSI